MAATSLSGRLRQRIRELKVETYSLYLAVRHPDTPWYAKVIVAVIVAYALSPIDLIPDFIPIIGLLDDLVLIPLGIIMAKRMIPLLVLAECRQRADQGIINGMPVSRTAGFVVMVIWVGLAALFTVWAYETFSS